MAGCRHGSVCAAGLASGRASAWQREREGTAVTWLLDLVPEYRQYQMVYLHPVVLASIARHLVHGQVEGARQGYRTAVPS